MKRSDILNFSIQINDGLTQTSGDGASLAFDKKYGIMFCSYMPGYQGSYGESRGRIYLTYFPASQPTNLRNIEITNGNDVYCNNILGLGDGKVRVFYEKNSRVDGDHDLCYKDFDFITKELSEEKTIMLKKDDGSIVKLTESEQFAYLEKYGFYNHKYWYTEQIALGSHRIVRAEDGYVYGAITSILAEPILYRSRDNLATVEFFAICPYTAQYEMSYTFLDGNIYAIFRTDRDENSISLTSSPDMGKTWTPAVEIKGSIQCRPRILTYQGEVLFAYNYFNADTGNRPAIQQGRTSVMMRYGHDIVAENNKVVADLYSKCGIVNIDIIDILNDIYMAYSTSELALEYQNGNPMVRGKDAVRYVKLGDLLEK